MTLGTYWYFNFPSYLFKFDFLLTEEVENTVSFENKIERIVKANSAKVGPMCGHEFYSQNGPKIEKIIEQEFIF